MTHRSFAQTLRQHHGIEHATVTLLSQRLPGRPIVARSDQQGFILFGDVDSETLRRAAEEALARLQAGESSLAVHPNCGTNLVTAGALSGVGALLMAAGRGRSWWDRVPSAVLGATLALILAMPAGRWMQENVTTSPNVAGLRITAVTRLEGGPVVRHRVAICSP